MRAYVYRARVATTQSQDNVPPIAARGEAAVVSGHSPLCRASVGFVKPPTKPPRAAPRSQVGMPQRPGCLGFQRYYLCSAQKKMF